MLFASCFSTEFLRWQFYFLFFFKRISWYCKVYRRNSDRLWSSRLLKISVDIHIRWYIILLHLLMIELILCEIKRERFNENTSMWTFKDLTFLFSVRVTFNFSDFSKILSRHGILLHFTARCNRVNTGRTIFSTLFTSSKASFREQRVVDAGARAFRDRRSAT